MNTQKKRMSEMTPDELENALKALDEHGPRPLKVTETGKPYEYGGNQAGSFKAFLENPPVDVLEMIAKSDPVLAAKMREDNVASAAAAFMKACPEYLPTDANYEAVMRRLARTHLGQPFTTSDQAEEALVDAGVFSTENITRTFKTLLAAGELEVRRGAVKKLNRKELREVAIAIETKGAEFAMLDYISLSLGGLPNDLESPDDLMVRHADLMNEAVLFVWPESRPSFESSAEWVKWFLAKRSGRVGVLTIAIMDQLWAEFKATSAFERSRSSAATSDTGVRTPDYSRMSSEEVTQLFEATQREARIARAKGGL